MQTTHTQPTAPNFLAPNSLASNFLATAILATALLAFAPGCRSTPPDAAPDMQAAMDKMMAAGNPGPEHAWLLEDAGSWKGDSKSWPGIGAEPVVMPSDFRIEPMLGGRFSACRYHATMEGMPDFEGLAITGFDMASRKFETMWIDSYGTTMMTGSGHRSADGRSLETTFTYFCPVRERRATMWQTITRESPSRQRHRMWAEDLATGAKYLMMDATYERVDAAGAR